MHAAHSQRLDGIRLESSAPIVTDAESLRAWRRELRCSRERLARELHRGEKYLRLRETGVCQVERSLTLALVALAAPLRARFRLEERRRRQRSNTTQRRRRARLRRARHRAGDKLAKHVIRERLRILASATRDGSLTPEAAARLGALDAMHSPATRRRAPRHSTPPSCETSPLGMIAGAVQRG